MSGERKIILAAAFLLSLLLPAMRLAEWAGMGLADILSLLGRRCW